MRGIRGLAGAAAGIVLLGALSVPAAGSDRTLLARRVDSAVAGFGGHASVLVTDVRSGYSYGNDVDRVVSAASLYKIGVMIEAYRRVAKGGLSLDDPITILDDDLEDDGYFTPSGTTLSFREAIERMIDISDNSPAQALVRILDAHQINATMSSLGLTKTRLNTALPEEERTAPFNTTTARDIGALLLGLAQGRIVSASASADMVAVLKRQTINDRLPSGLPSGTAIAHKTGDLDGVAHDAGIVWTPNGRRVVVMLTTDGTPDDVVALAEQLASTAYGVPVDDFAARYATAPASIVARPGAPVAWTVGLRNASTFTWGADTYLVERLKTPAASQEISRVPLAGVAPGAASSVSLQLVSPSEAGLYVIEVEVVDAELGASGNTLPVVLVVRP